jgi:hypothetical protein
MNLYIPQKHNALGCPKNTKLLIASIQPFHGSSPFAATIHPQAPCNQTYLALAIINTLD